MLIRCLAIMCGIVCLVCEAVALERFVFHKFKDSFLIALCGIIFYPIFLALIDVTIKPICLLPILGLAATAIVAYKYYKEEKPEKKMSKERVEEFKHEYRALLF